MFRAQYRFQEAVPEYETAITLDPNWGSALAALIWCKLYTGSIEEAVALAERAIHINPGDAQIGNWYQRIGFAHLLQSHTDEAIHWFEKARSQNPGHPAPHIYLASAYGLAGETDRAASELAEARRLTGDDRYSSIARVKAREWGWQKSALWSKPRILPACARPGYRKNRPHLVSTAVPGQAARRRVSWVHTSLSAVTSASISASLCNGDGVRRRRSVPRGTVG